MVDAPHHFEGGLFRALGRFACRDRLGMPSGTDTGIEHPLQQLGSVPDRGSVGDVSEARRALPRQEIRRGVMIRPR